MPVIVPLIALVTAKVVIVALVAVKLFKVPTEVNEEFTILGASVVPVRVFALIAKVISVVPLKNTPLIFLPV